MIKSVDSRAAFLWATVLADSAMELSFVDDQIFF